ncbi:MAG: hypothetical protein DMG15_27445 [Acidobacteria bacterium]|nr:MAG: hypothetical protein DMG15_27445 [Acidobacteriota bacterium]
MKPNTRTKHSRVRTKGEIVMTGTKKIVAGLVFAVVIVGSPILAHATDCISYPLPQGAILSLPQAPNWPDSVVLRAPTGEAFIVYGGAAFSMGMGFVGNYSFGLFVPWQWIPWDKCPRDGTVVKERSRAEVYVFYRGAKLWIKSPVVLFQAGFTWNDVRTIPDGTMRSIRSTNGMVWREMSSPEVYVSYGGMKFWIASPDILRALGFKWDDVIVIRDGLLSAFSATPTEWSPPLRELSSTAVYDLNETPGQKRLVTTLGQYCFPSVVPDGALASLPSGPNTTLICIG